MSPENKSGWELASSDELVMLQGRTIRLVQDSGTYSISSRAKIEGELNGLPISDEQPRWSLEVSKDEAYELFPEAAVTLNLGGVIEIAYFDACYTRVGTGELEYQIPMCYFSMDYPDDYPFSRRFIFIFLDAEGKADSSCESELRDKKTLQPLVPEYPQIDLVARLLFEHSTELNKMKREEYLALSEVVSILQDQIE